MTVITSKERTKVKRDICMLIMLRVKETNEEKATFLVNEWEEELWKVANGSGQVYLEKYHKKKKHLETEVEFLATMPMLHSHFEEMASIKARLIDIKEEKRAERAQQEVPESSEVLRALEDERVKVEYNLIVLLARHQVDEKDADATNCTVCFENKLDCKLSGCSHLFCAHCVNQFHRKLCPLCRAPFTKTERVLF
jgi:mannose-6-phosphate isomerase-like protein (cupin superfamily)